ncbi:MULTISPECIES: peptidoglycan bridge formation glycyltransferase FemA/FemB family protein [unclassified Anabaena]|uniref:lipid II:glycine glycyltransferase FemX n=1 Tax=unclassified Anabaena TaxID=2619674 RepID=UPI00144841F2|nr:MULTISPECIES: peptidoglycan bridge formation glycyltransferase FemA/FemB family protein [unclassified Anabaena]MTJ08294.1 peptidoglycan bridge formation glycyltransferase FemA/FemB family protein [Anabaena sp. UHCC 0204]MTJ51607.1 peptidoglycan bridge formation glycyltransferase FemA/FemB family protein [Anabaena sp. UHCC 0253]
MTHQNQLTIRKLTQKDQENWQILINNSQFSSFMQTWTWADFKELEGYKTFRYGLFLNNYLVGGCIYYLYPHTNKANLLISPGGPILPENYPEEGINLLLKTAEKIAQTMGGIAFRIEPNWHEKPDYLQGFVRSPADLLPNETLLIDLRPDNEQILAAMKPKGRYNIRLSQRYHVNIEFSNDSQSIPLFYDLFWETAQRQNFFAEPYGFFINLCQTLFTTNMIEIGLATWKGEIIAAILVIYCGNVATYLYGGTSLLHREVMASYGLHWEAMQKAKIRGCQFYDFYGFTKEPNHAYTKFSQFKSRFGGTYRKTIGAHDYFFYDQLADTLISLFQTLIGNKNE